MQSNLTSSFGGDAEAVTDEEGEESPDDSPKTTTSSVDNTRSAQNGQVREIKDSELAEWVAEHEANGQGYGYFHLYAVVESSLSGAEYHLKQKREIVQPSSKDSPTAPSTMFGVGSTDPEYALEQVINWKLGHLAKPFHPKTRDIPADQLRVFVAKPAREKLRNLGKDVDGIVSTLNDLSEHEPDDQHIEKAREYAEAKAATKGTDATKRVRVSAIEKTLRARLGFTSRLGHTVPNPDPDYVDQSTTELETALDEAREDLERTEQQRDELRTELKEEREEWVETAYSNLFGDLN